MDIHLIPNTHDRDPIRLFVSGKLEAEIVCGTVLTATDLAREVTEARALRRLAYFVRQWQKNLETMKTIPDPAERTPQARQAAFCRGLEAGLCGVTVPYGRPLVPPLPPEHTASFRAGWDHGETMRRAVALALGAEETPHA